MDLENQYQPKAATTHLSTWSRKKMFTTPLQLLIPPRSEKGLVRKRCTTTCFKGILFILEQNLLLTLDGPASTERDLVVWRQIKDLGQACARNAVDDSHINKMDGLASDSLLSLCHGRRSYRFILVFALHSQKENPGQTKLHMRLCEWYWPSILRSADLSRQKGKREAGALSDIILVTSGSLPTDNSGERGQGLTHGMSCSAFSSLTFFCLREPVGFKTEESKSWACRLTWRQAYSLMCYGCGQAAIGLLTTLILKWVVTWVLISSSD